LIAVRPKILVNASGAWIDFTNRALQRQSRYIGGTKGSHIVIDHKGLLEATRGQMLYFANADGRICVFYPFYDKVIAGSTDIPVEDPEAAFCEEEEVDYILESIRQVVPTIRVDRSCIIFRFCGVRPLPRSDASTPGQVSRDHMCAVLPAGNGIEFPVYSLIGGKWTTFRAFGEQVAEALLSVLRRPRLASSAELPIGGGKGYPRGAREENGWLSALQGKTGLSLGRLEQLLERYGTRAGAVAEFLTAAPDAPLDSHPEYTRREIQFMASHERIVHLEDLILRRTILALRGQVSLDLLEELAGVLAPALGWSQERIKEEVERTIKTLRKAYGVEAEQESLKPTAHSGDSQGATAHT
jgi:glycerol-3-phosphate dehydrogenase